MIYNAFIIIKVRYRELICAGKKIHEILLGVENVGETNVVAEKYVQECQIMTSLRHPNITLFLGLFLPPGAQLPLLVMERLECSLDDLLEKEPNIPRTIKHSILENIACGLLYLHKMEPTIIHRDLTSRNVLLTASLVAKITDMGNSRIVNPKLSKALTKVPGTFVYMAPEALDSGDSYGPSLDVFSFGHLALYTIIQVRK